MKYKLKRLKRKFRYNKKRSTFFLFLFLLVCSVGLGYAALSTTLSIDGSAQFKDARWNVYFNNLNVTNGSVTATTAASITNTTTVSFAARLENPGDFYEFTVDVVNGGNMNAMIDSFNILPELTTAQQNYLSYTVTYRDGADLAQYQKLEAGRTEKIKVRFEYLENSDASLYPTEDDNLTVAFDVTYVQADSNAIEVNHLPINGIVYTMNIGDLTSENNKKIIFLNQQFPKNIPYFDTQEEVMDYAESIYEEVIPFYLKHKVVNGIVTESYVEFVVTDELVQENPGMVPGTYSLRGDITWDDEIGNYAHMSLYYDANVGTEKTAFGYATNPSRCTEYDNDMTYGTNIECFNSVFSVYSNLTGNISIGDMFGTCCQITNFGSSYCIG